MIKDQIRLSLLCTVLQNQAAIMQYLAVRDKNRPPEALHMARNAVKTAEMVNEVQQLLDEEPDEKEESTDPNSGGR